MDREWRRDVNVNVNVQKLLFSSSQFKKRNSTEKELEVVPLNSGNKY